MLLKVQNCNQDPGLMLVRTAITDAACLSAPCYCKQAISLQMSHKLKIYAFQQSLPATTYKVQYTTATRYLQVIFLGKTKTKRCSQTQVFQLNNIICRVHLRVYVNKINSTFKYCMYYKC